MSDGLSQTTIEYRIEVNTDRALNDVKDAIAKVRADLPRGIEEPLISRLDIVGLPIVSYAVSASNKTIEDICPWFVDDVVARRVQGIKGVSSVPRIGGVDVKSLSNSDTDRLLALGVTAGDVSRQLRATNIDLAGGRGEIGGREQSIRRWPGRELSMNLRRRRSPFPAGVRCVSPILARSATRPPNSVATHASTESRCRLRRDARHRASDAVVSKIIEGETCGHPQGFPEVRIDKIDSNVDYTVGNYESAMKTLLEGAALSVLVVSCSCATGARQSSPRLHCRCRTSRHSSRCRVWAFRSISSPARHHVATGVLVDDAIVEIENIVRHMHMGKSPTRRRSRPRTRSASR